MSHTRAVKIPWGRKHEILCAVNLSGYPCMKSATTKGNNKSSIVERSEETYLAFDLQADK